MTTTQLPKPGDDFHFGTGKAGHRGLGYQLRKMSSTGRSGVTAFRNLSKDNIKTIEGILKPYRKSLKGIGTYSSSPGLGKYEIKRANRKAWKAFKSDIGSGKSESKRFTKEDLKDFKKITKELSKEEQKKSAQTKPKFIYRRPYLEDENNTSGVVSISGMSRNRSIDTGISHGATSISQLMKGETKSSVGGTNLTSGVSGNFSAPKPINRNFGLKI